MDKLSHGTKFKCMEQKGFGYVPVVSISLFIAIKSCWAVGAHFEGSYFIFHFARDPPQFRLCSRSSVNYFKPDSLIKQQN